MQQRPEDGLDTPCYTGLSLSRSFSIVELGPYLNRLIEPLQQAILKARSTDAHLRKRREQKSCFQNQLDRQSRALEPAGPDSLNRAPRSFRRQTMRAVGHFR